MAFATDNRTHTATLTDRVQDVVARVQDHLRVRKIYRDTLTELEQLTTAELADIGIHRSQLRTIAREAAENA